MEAFFTEDVVTVFRKSANLNAAVKNFLKREARATAGSERFAKELRDAFLAKNEERAIRFVEKELEKTPLRLLALGLYAHHSLISKIAGDVIESYADDFNKTYEADGNSIKVKDAKTFDRILGEVDVKILGHIDAEGLGSSNFLKEIARRAIFDQGVLEYPFDS